MNGEKAIELVKEIYRNKDSLPNYNVDLVDQISKEIKHLVEENIHEAEASGGELGSNMNTVKIRHIAIRRNLRCLLAYHYNRLKSLQAMRWEFGSILPQDIKTNLSVSEFQYFGKYSNALTKYMRSIGDEGINLALNSKPPKSLYIEVRCLVDYGKHQLSDGTVLMLKKNTRHFLPRNECEEFIRLQIFEHIV